MWETIHGIPYWYGICTETNVGYGIETSCIYIPVSIIAVVLFIAIAIRIYKHFNQ